MPREAKTGVPWPGIELEPIGNRLRCTDQSLNEAWAIRNRLQLGALDMVEGCC